MMLYSRLVAFGLVLVFQGRDAVENQKDECLTDCKRKVMISYFFYTVMPYVRKPSL